MSGGVWEGFVIEVAETEFSGRFMTSDDGEFEANFPIDNVAPEQRHQVEEGAQFRIHVGKRPPRLEMVSLPPPTQEEIDRAHAWAREAARTWLKDAVEPMPDA